MGELTDFIEQIREEIPLIVNEISKEVCLAMVSYGVYNTPVDTSKLISNWTVNFNTAPPDGSDIEAHFVGIGGDTLSSSAQETIERARVDLSLKIPGDVIYLSNTTPYIGYVNDGTDKIAASNFIEGMVITGNNYEPANGPEISVV